MRVHGGVVHLVASIFQLIPYPFLPIKLLYGVVIICFKFYSWFLALKRAVYFLYIVYLIANVLNQIANLFAFI